MAKLLTKPLANLTAADVDEFCELKVAESEMVELKEAVPHKERKSAPWSGENLSLSNYANRTLRLSRCWVALPKYSTASYPPSPSAHGCGS